MEKTTNSELNQMKIKKSRLQQIIREELTRVLSEAIDVVNRKTGEVIPFGDDSMTGIPDAAVPDLVRRLGLNLSPNDELSPEDFAKLEDETVNKQYDRQAKKDYASHEADQERLNIDNLRRRLRDWADDAAEGWKADHASGNQEYPIEVVAFDLADSAQHHFREDEWNELLYDVDNKEEELRDFIMGSMKTGEDT